jgi:hypothetical protein
MEDAQASIPRKYPADFRALIENPLFLEQPDFRSQMVMTTRILREKERRVPFSAITVFFGVPKGTNQRHWKRSKQEMFPSGRRTVLSEEIIAHMVQHVKVQFEQGQPACNDAKFDWPSTQFHLLVLPDTMRPIIRRTGAFKTVLGIPIESGRCHVTNEVIQGHFRRLEVEIDNVPAGFIFNADESGLQDFVDAREIQVIVPGEFDQDSTSAPSTRSEKRATMLVAVSAHGCSLKPIIIIPRKTY